MNEFFCSRLLAIYISINLITQLFAERKKLLLPGIGDYFIH